MSSVRIGYVGHATVVVEMAGRRLLTDPVLRGRVAYLKRVAPVGRVEDPDAVLISHAHFDHLDVPSLRGLRRCPAVAPRGCGRLLARAGLGPVTELETGGSADLGAVEVTAVRVAHDGRRHPFSRAREALGYAIAGEGMRVFFAGDTDLFDGMRDLAEGLDVALLPVTGWGRYVRRGHLDPERAARAVALLRPRVAVPIHWGTLASRGATWRDDPERPARGFARRAAELAPGVEVRVLQPGESTTVERAS